MTESHDATSDIPIVPPLPADLVKRARVLSRREEILPLLPTNGIICEVGVAYGDFSEQIIRVCRPRKFIAIDLFNIEDYPDMWGYDRLKNKNHLEYYRSRFSLELEARKMDIMVGFSTDMLPNIPDASVDAFYIDAWHSYESVSAELSIINQKIKPNGWIVLNDYVLYDVVARTPYGVIPALHEFMLRENWEMRYFALHPWMYCDVAIRRRQQARRLRPWHAKGATPLPPVRPRR